MARHLLIVAILATVPMIWGSPLPPFDILDSVPSKPVPRADKDYRLPGESTPSSYKIILTIDPDKPDSFDGQTNITIKAERSSVNIVLHAKYMTFKNISVKEVNAAAELYDSHVMATDDTHFLTIKLKSNLTAGKEYKINIDYSGKYGKNMHGIYISSYASGGTSRFLAVTQFEPVSAREAFPCYDEPALKADFQVNIYCPPRYHSISNTNVDAITDLPNKEGFNLTSFQKTPKMSTYLVAFVISDFGYLTNNAAPSAPFPKLFRVSSRPSGVNFLGFSLDFGQRSLKALEDYTNVTYALSKMDNVAIPDFSAGAMENWGIITYREPLLMNEPGVTTTRNLESIATVISHENAHQWFGNEVSPKWWGYLWLSEGFATYFEDFTTNQVLPEWRLMDQYVVTTVQRAMVPDSLPTTNPMSSDVMSPSEIDNNFNIIAYQKSGSVIRMFQHAMGADKFREGLKIYLKSIPKGVGEPNILFKALGDAMAGTNILPPNMTITDAFGSWANQKGYPLITVTRTSDTAVSISQKRYLQDPALNGSEQWWVPLSWATSSTPYFNQTLPDMWLRPNMTHEQFLNNSGWYIMNKQQSGYFRVMYDKENYKRLADALSSSDMEKIHLLNRAQLLDDALEFSKTYRLSYNVTFDLMNYMKNETDYIPWFSAYPSILNLNTRLAASDKYFWFIVFIQSLNRKSYDMLGNRVRPNDDPITKLYRVLSVTLSCNMGYQKCRDDCLEVLEEWSDNSTKTVDLDLQQITYCSAIRRGSSKHWNFIWQKFANETIPQQRSIYLSALGCSEDTALINQYLLKSIQDNPKITQSDKNAIIESVINGGEKGFALAFDFVFNYFSTLQLQISSTTRIINAIGPKLVTKNQIQMFEEFVANNQNKFTQTEKVVAASNLNLANKNRQWFNFHYDDISSWLEQNVSFSGAFSQTASILLISSCFIVALLNKN